MWTRAELKALGKESFKRFYWVAVAICLVTTFLTGTSSSSNNVNHTQEYTYYDEDFNQEFTYYDETLAPDVYELTLNGLTLSFNASDNINLGTISTFFNNIIVSSGGTNFVPLLLVTFLVLSLIVNIFIINPIVVGKNYFFVKIQRSESRFSDLFIIFKKRLLTNVGLTMFIMYLYIFLWSLLFIIPGIIKSYEYRMVPYILSENPSISRRRAFELSRDMMSGEKLDTFILDLSFIGWHLLSGFTFGLLHIFYVNPYIEATFAQLYAVLRRQALDQQFATSVDLPGFN